MEWLNIHTSVMDSQEFIRSHPIDRATWLALQRYCVGQENGGRIVGCKPWGDRSWQQLCRVTLREVKRSTELWHWDGQDLVVFAYPIEQEALVQVRRESARVNGKSGGRPLKTREKPALVIAGLSNGNPLVTGEEPTPESVRVMEGKDICKGKDKEGGTAQAPAAIATTPPMEAPKVEASKEPQPPYREIMEAWNGSDMPGQALVLNEKRKVSIRARWREPFFRENWRAAIARMRASDFCMGARGREGWTGATIDFFLQPSTVLKVMEGKYDNGKPKTKTPHGEF